MLFRLNIFRDIYRFDLFFKLNGTDDKSKILTSSFVIQYVNDLDHIENRNAGSCGKYFIKT